MKSGIYKIINNINNKIYIGSAVNLPNRKSTHFCALKGSYHHNLHLQNAVNKYGIENFKFEIIEYCIKEELILREQYWIDLLKPKYNKRQDAQSNFGVKRPDLIQRNLKMAEQGINKGENHPMYGKFHSIETRQLMSNRLRGVSHSEERIERRKMFSKGKGNAFYNKKHTEDSKLKMSITKRKNKMEKKYPENDYINRLFKEWKTHGSIILAVDFDSTISPWDSIDNKKDIERCLKLVKDVKSTGAYIVIFTACDPNRYDEIRGYCTKEGIKVDTINENPITLKYGNARKIYYNHLLDDRSGFIQAMDMLEVAMYKQRGHLEQQKLLNSDLD